MLLDDVGPASEHKVQSSESTGSTANRGSDSGRKELVLAEREPTPTTAGALTPSALDAPERCSTSEDALPLPTPCKSQAASVVHLVPEAPDHVADATVMPSDMPKSPRTSNAAAAVDEPHASPDLARSKTYVAFQNNLETLDRTESEVALALEGDFPVTCPSKGETGRTPASDCENIGSPECETGRVSRSSFPSPCVAHDVATRANKIHARQESPSFGLSEGARLHDGAPSNLGIAFMEVKALIEDVSTLIDGPSLMDGTKMPHVLVNDVLGSTPDILNRPTNLLGGFEAPLSPGQTAQEDSKLPSHTVALSLPASPVAECVGTTDAVPFSENVLASEGQGPTKKQPASPSRSVTSVTAGTLSIEPGSEVTRKLDSHVNDPTHLERPDTPPLVIDVRPDALSDEQEGDSNDSAPSPTPSAPIEIDDAHSISALSSAKTSGETASEHAEDSEVESTHVQNVDGGADVILSCEDPVLPSPVRIEQDLVTNLADR